MRTLFALVLVLICSASPMTGAAQGGTTFTLVRTISLPRVEGRIDHLAFDPIDQRLFVCALGNNTVEIIDVRKGDRVRSLAGLGSPQAVTYIPDFDQIVVASDRGGICKRYDGKAFRPLSEVDLGDDADNIRYDRVGKQLYIGFGAGGIAILNASDGKQVGSIELSAHPEAFQLEENGHRIFVNVPTSRHIAVIDRNQKKVIATWGTDSAFANFPMALDEPNHRLFVGCRMPAKLLVLNTDSGEIVTKTRLSGDCDDLFYDAKRHRIYAICGAGKLDIIDQGNPNVYNLANSVDTADGARTGLFVAERDELFVALPRRGRQAAEIRLYHIE
jgi:DNA-binding beta-propeller fold protein YncE